MIMANDEVEVFDNTIEQNQTAGLSIVSYLITDKPIKDAKYDPFCEAIYVHDNRFADNGGKPAGPTRRDAGARSWGPRCRTSSTTASSTRRSRSTASCPTTLAIRIHDNGKAGFANFDALGLEGRRARARRKQPEHRPRPQGLRRARPALAPVSIEGLK